VSDEKKTPSKSDKDAPGKTTGPSKAKNDYRIPESSAWAGYWKIFAGVGVLGLAAAGFGYTQDPERFAFSYLFAFFLFLTVAFGGTFFVLIERLTSAHWSVVVRRTAEFFMGGMPVFVVLFIPVFMSMGHLFPWLHPAGEHGAEHGAEHAAPAEKHSSLAIIPEAHAQQPAPPAPPAAAAPTRDDGHGGGAGTGGGHGSGSGTGAAHNGGTGTGTGGNHGQHSGTGGGAAAGDDGPARMAGSGGGHAAGVGGGEHMGKGRPDPLELAEEKVMAKKSPYLNKNAFLVRVIVYFAIWLFLAARLFGFSTKQDTSKDPKLTLAAQSFAPGGTILFALSLTFAAFDWLMSLNPGWYSTIFGVTIFAGSVVAIFATLIVVTMALRDDGLLKDVLKVEHFHDMGKLLFGFMVFWAYVNFSQFMLIWYASLPEETVYFHLRWDVGPWKNISLAIVFLHFVVPFFTIVSRNAKRRLSVLRIGAIVLLAMHAVEMYWIVMPNYKGGESSFHWMDAACFLGVGGLYLALVFNRMTKHPLIPIGDPRLARSLHHEIENA
jgi:hypothetical protein